MRFKEIITTLVLPPLLVGVLTFFLGVWWTKRENRVQYLDYYSTGSVDFLKDLKEIGDSINLSINRKTVTDLSQLEIAVFNNTEFDLEDVPIFIELFSEDGRDVPVFLTDYYDHNGSKESIQVQTVSNSERSGGRRFGYLLKIVNRSGKEPIFRIKFLIERKTVPNFKVQTSKKSLEIRPLDIQNNENSSLASFVDYILPTLAVALTITIFFTTFLSQKRSRESEALEKVVERTINREDLIAQKLDVLFRESVKSLKKDP